MIAKELAVGCIRFKDAYIWRIHGCPQQIYCLILRSMSKARDNFLRLAEPRTNKAIKAMELVGNLSNRSNYTYSAEEAQRIVGALRKQLKEVEARFLAQAAQKNKPKFEL